MPRVLLITGPGGSGKTTLAGAVAERSGWVHLCEDDRWVAHGWGGTRTPEQEAAVRAEVLGEVRDAVAAGRDVVLDLVLYALPPSPLTAYEDVLDAHGVPHDTLVLRPTVAEIVARMTARGRPTDLADLATRRAQAVWQVHCARSAAVDPAWVVDPTGLSVEETLDRTLALLASGP